MAVVYDPSKHFELKDDFFHLRNDFSRLAIGRPLLTAPGVPKQRVALLRKAFMDTMKDPDFLREAKLLRLEVNPLSGEQVEELLEKISNYSPEVITQVKKIVLESK